MISFPNSICMRNIGKSIQRARFFRQQYIAPEGVIERSIIGEGSEIYGKVYNSVIGCGVTIGKDSVVRDSIIMNNTVIGSGCELNKAIIAGKCTGRSKA